MKKPYKSHRMDDVLRERFSEEELRDIKKAAKRDALEYTLKELRRFAGKTQVEAAEAAEMSQSNLSELENREDYRLSTLRRYVEALGGELEVVAVFGDRRLRVHTLDAEGNEAA